MAISMKRVVYPFVNGSINNSEDPNEVQHIVIMLGKLEILFVKHCGPIKLYACP